ncbi:divalent cation tolerance protein CutA [Streptosporangium sp. V21-05]|uniref:divalent cation tolerance protein CutA n=1 Tax=Streptosporangium sp. V21-05 TaxID=3446115 RepID=UPI003F529CA2
MAEYVRAFTMAESAQEADALARSILQARLVAEVHIAGPVRSLRWWEDLLEEVQEWEVTMTTNRDLLPLVEEHLRRKFSMDDRFKLVATSLTYGSREKLLWIDSQTIQPPNKPAS